jgi:palmitoyltransferase ZDHHC9/14/18
MEVTIEAHEETLVQVAQTAAHATPQPTPEVAQSEGKRPPRRSRGAVTTYNVQILAGTAIHTPTKYLEKHHGNVLHGSLEDVRPTNTAPSPKKRTPRRVADEISDPAEAQLATETAQAAQRRKSSRSDLRKDALRNSTAAGDGVAQKQPGFFARAGRAGSKILGSLRIDMNDSGPTGYAQSAEKKVIAKLERTPMTDEAEHKEGEDGEEEKEYAQPKTKKWLQQGLFVGQDREFDARLSETKNRKKRKSKQIKRAPALPLPMFSMEANLEDGNFRRDFKLPFDVYHPLPKKVKVDGWVKLQKSKLHRDETNIVLANIAQIDLLVMRQLCGSEISRIRPLATANLRKAAGMPVTTASWPTNVIAPTVGSLQRSVATALSPI